MMPARRAVLAACLPAGLPALATAQDVAGVGVVYHVDSGLEQASRALRGIRNHLAAEPGVKIVVVALAEGVDFLLQGAEDAGGYPYELTVQQLAEQGVEFRVCRNTLAARDIDPGRVLAEATVVPSGVAEAARLQVRDGYAYLKP